MSGDVTSPYSKTLKWAIISSRLLALPVLIETLFVGWGVVYAAFEGPGAFSGYGVIVLALLILAGMHAAPAVGCMVVGWRMTRRRGLGLVPRASATWGAIFGFLHFGAPLSFVLIDQHIEIFLWIGIFSLFTWPALVFAILCVRLRAHAPPKEGSVEILSMGEVEADEG